ncbi:MAG: Rhodanese domain protein [Chlorobi bacterium]|nr:Rhodanese domain protein [Chlorobiota bacterium]
MTDDTSTKQQRTPLGIAWREARAIIMISLGIMICYNIFAAPSIDIFDTSAVRLSWIYKARRHDTAATAGGLLPDTSTTTTIAVPATADTAPAVKATGPDTLAPIATIDTAGKGASAAELKARKDSVEKARLEAKRIIDSATKARGTGVLDKVAGMKEISTDIAKQLFDMKGAMFIDARPEDHYNEGHIAGAMNVYADQWQTSIPELIKIPKDRLIVTYCGGGDACELSHELADHLRDIGFKKVVVYTGGIKDWTAKNYPLTK